MWRLFCKETFYFTKTTVWLISSACCYVPTMKIWFTKRVGLIQSSSSLWKQRGGFVAPYYNMSAAFTACLPSVSCMIVDASEISKALKYLLIFTEYSRSVFKRFIDSARAGDVSSDLCFMQKEVMELVMWISLQICSFSDSKYLWLCVWYMGHLYLSFSEIGCKENLLHTQSCVFACWISEFDFKP